MDNENKEYFGFNAHSGGYFPFEGVMDNDKEIDEIITNYSFDNVWDMEICKKIRCVLSYMNKYDIVQLS